MSRYKKPHFAAHRYDRPPSAFEGVMLDLLIVVGWTGIICGGLSLFS